MPPFTFPEFFASNGAAIRRLRAHQKALKDRWTTPALRPLAEPPYIEWPETIDDLLPSDKRHRILFPHDAEKRARMKDLTGEKCALGEYFAFLEGIIVEEREYPLRQMFWKGLIEEVFVDEQGVMNEILAFLEEAEPLRVWEYRFLDQDGEGTELLESTYWRVDEAFRSSTEPEILEKYGEVRERMERRKKEVDQERRKKRETTA